MRPLSPRVGLNPTKFKEVPYLDQFYIGPSLPEKRKFWLTNYNRFINKSNTTTKQFEKFHMVHMTSRFSVVNSNEDSIN